jgi:hypothetical protein
MTTKPFDRAGMLAQFYRHGMHNLDPFWSPDAEAMVNPLDEPETQSEIRRYIRKLHQELRLGDNEKEGTS